MIDIYDIYEHIHVRSLLVCGQLISNMYALGVYFKGRKL